MPDHREGLPESPPLGDQAPRNAETPPAAFRSLITPNADRFIREHFPQPARVPEFLEIGGAVGHPVRASLAELQELPAITLTVTTECAGNSRTALEPRVGGEQWTGGALSTSQWTGVPLERLLAWAGLKESAAELVFHSADGGYVRSLPVAKARDADTLVAWELNGEPIPPRFGGPLRLIVPDWYGMASVKWLARIEVVEAPFEGYFQTTRYVYEPGRPVTTMRVKSRFLDPAPSSVLKRGRVRVRGLAWGGEGGVVQVDVAIGADDYRPARLLGPTLPHAWRRFELDWEAKTPGRFELRCRARDAAGNLQPEAPEWNQLGYGVNPIERLTVEIA